MWRSPRAGLAALCLVMLAPALAAAPKVLRIASESETGFDPARVGDVRSFRVISHIFETLLRYDPLARPVKLQPGTAAALPEPSADFRTWTVRLQPGIYFTDDPAFGGRPRELVAADYAYSIRRLADPATKSPGWSSIEQAGISGLAALRPGGCRPLRENDSQRHRIRDDAILGRGLCAARSAHGIRSRSRRVSRF